MNTNSARLAAFISTAVLARLASPAFSGQNGRVMEPEQLEKRLLSEVARASADFGLLEPGDRVLVAVSGGKDSHALLYLLREVARRAPFDFSLIAVNVDQGHPGFPERLLP